MNVKIQKLVNYIGRNWKGRVEVMEFENGNLYVTKRHQDGSVCQRGYWYPFENTYVPSIDY